MLGSESLGLGLGIRRLLGCSTIRWDFQSGGGFGAFRASRLKGLLASGARAAFRLYPEPPKPP